MWNAHIKKKYFLTLILPCGLDDAPGRCLWCVCLFVWPGPLPIVPPGGRAVAATRRRSFGRSVRLAVGRRHFSALRVPESNALCRCFIPIFPQPPFDWFLSNSFYNSIHSIPLYFVYSSYSNPSFALVELCHLDSSRLPLRLPFAAFSMHRYLIRDSWHSITDNG